jgi:hypothetical protein
MSDAAEQTKELQEQLDFTAKLAKQKVEDDLKNARERWREQETAKTLAFQQEKFDFVAGSPRNYVGFKFVSDGVEATTAEWTLVISTTKLTREEAMAMVSQLQERLK